MKQKVLFASQESDSELKYDPTLVHGMFVHSFSLGLQNENIKMEMKPHLEKESVSDEELFEKLNVCISNEMERSQKFGSQLTPKVNAVQEAGDRQTEKNRELKAEVAVVKEKVRASPPSQAQPSPTQQPMRQPPQCRSCQQNGNGWFCNHCFKCGISGYYARECTAQFSQRPPTELQGNGQRSRPWDRV